MGWAPAALVVRCAAASTATVCSMTLGIMPNDAIWVAVLTGGTAVLASWVTSRGNARAARTQAEASAQTQQQSRSRETRRTAYLEFIEQAHITGELYWRLGDVYAQLTDPGERLAAIHKLRASLRDAFDPLSRCARVIILEGPAPVVEAAEAVKQAASDANHVLWEISQAEPGARERFDDAYRIFRVQLGKFIEAAQTAMAGPN